MSVEIQQLDDEWIYNFENTDNLYKDFYKDNLYYVHLKIIYVNRENDIDKLKTETFLMSTPNYISREEMLGILKKHSTDNNIKYSLLSILKYNIVLDTDQVNSYLKYTDNEMENYLNVIKHIDAISFDKSISMFHDLNELIFIFYEKSKELIEKKNINHLTKKIYLRLFHSRKKTIKKRYKD